MPGYQLRPYQDLALQASVDAFAAGCTRQLIHLPTGTGKTVVVANLKRRHGFSGRMLFLAHRKELIDQAVEKIAKETGLRRSGDGRNVIGIEQGEVSSWAGNPIVVASVQSLANAVSKRLNTGRLDPREFDLIVCDEAHHSTAASYRTIFRHFGLLEPSNSKLLVGVTATPERFDGVGLDAIYDKIVFTKTILECIEEGWLTDLRAFRLHTSVCLDDVPSSSLEAGDVKDFDEGELGRTINTKARNELIVRNWKEIGSDRKTLAFCATIAHAKSLAEEFRLAGVSAEAVWGNDPDRTQKLESHRGGKLAVLTNCNVLTEGYDDWSIKAIVLARPTLSTNFFTQMIGRGTRIQSDIRNLLEARARNEVIKKNDCLVIDVVDNTKNHRLVSVASLFGLNSPDYDFQQRYVSKAIRENPELLLRNDSAMKPLHVVTEVHEINLFAPLWTEDILRTSRLRWIRRKDGWLCPLPDGDFMYFASSCSTWLVTGTIEGQPFGQKGFLTAVDASNYAQRILRGLGKKTAKLLSSEAGHLESSASPVQRALIRHKAPDLSHQQMDAATANRLIEALYGDVEEKSDRFETPIEYLNRSWTNALCRQPVMRWYPAEGRAFEVPLPEVGYLRLEHHANKWIASGECHGTKVEKTFHLQLDSAISYLENAVMSCDQLRQLLEIEMNWVGEGPTPFIESLLNFLGEDLSRFTTREAAEQRARELFKVQLDPLRFEDVTIEPL